MDFRVEIYKKIGYVNYGDDDASKIILRNSLASIRINRARSTQVSEATIVAEYEKLPLATFRGGNKGIIDNYARIEIWFADVCQFSGIIKKYEYNEDDKTITLTCHDMFYRLLNCAETDINYSNTTAANIIEALVIRVGLSFYRSGGTDYSVSNLKISEGTVFMDVIQQFIETMHANVRCNKHGTVILEDQYPPYIEGGGDKNHFNWTYTDKNNNSSDNAGRDASLMKNILKITCAVKNVTYFDKFEDISMTSYLNDERWYDIIDNALANTKQKRQAVAGWQFLEYWRNSTPLTVLPTIGNKDIDIGHVVKLLRDNIDPGYYLVVGIDSEINADNGYTNTLQLEGMRDKNLIYQNAKLLSSGTIKEAS